RPSVASRLTTAHTLPTLRLVDRGTTHHRTDDLNVFDFLVVDRKKIVRQDDEVRQFSRRDGSLDSFLMRIVGAVEGVDSQRLFHGDALIVSPGLPIPSGARDHPLNAHARVERSWTEVRACRHLD